VKKFKGEKVKKWKSEKQEGNRNFTFSLSPFSLFHL